MGPICTFRFIHTLIIPHTAQVAKAEAGRYLGTHTAPATNRPVLLGSATGIGDKMSVARGFGLNGKSLYSNVCKPCDIHLNFIVDAANGNGLGIRSLKSNGYVQNVFMNTSSTPGTNNGQLNPNPAAGYALIQLKNNFNYYLGGFSGFVSPVSGTPLTSTTQHDAYIITSLGTATLAQWQAAGVPAGLTPSVGMSFIATATGTVGGSATVEAPSTSGILSIEVVGDPNQSIRNSNLAQNAGAYLLVQFLAPTSSSVTTPTATSPASGTVVGMCIQMDASSITIDGI